MPQLKQNVVRQIGDIVDAADAAQLQTLAHPVRRRTDLDAAHHTGRVARAEIVVENLDRGGLGGLLRALDHLRLRTAQRAAIDRRQFARDAEVVHGVGPVRRDVELEYDFALFLAHAVDGHAGHGQRVGEIIGRFGRIDKLPQPA